MPIEGQGGFTVSRFCYEIPSLELLIDPVLDCVVVGLLDDGAHCAMPLSFYYRSVISA